jgi:hypothetical protein
LFPGPKLHLLSHHLLGYLKEGSGVGLVDSFAIGSGMECKYGCGAIMMLMKDIKIKKLE